jgi:hypothetical protein
MKLPKIMKLPRSAPARLTARAKFGLRRGFALVLTLLLMILLTVIAVSLLSLSSISLRESGASRTMPAARANAKLALGIALGELQSKLGPDQRVSATADILPTTDPTKKYWTGAWDSETGSHLGWLVSGEAPDSAAADLPLWGGSQTHDGTADYVRLAGAGTTDTAVAGNGIIVPLQSITPTLPGTSTTGRYGWWVADEGVKARIDLVDPSAERVAISTGSPAVPAVVPSDDAKRRSVMVPGRTGGELLATEASPPATAPAYLGDAYPATGTANPATASFLRDLGKVLDTKQVELLNTGVTRNFRQRRFHDFTVSSRGVLADVAAGGLKKDLTAAFLGNATEQAKLPDATPLFTIPPTASTTSGHRILRNTDDKSLRPGSMISSAPTDIAACC